MAKPTHQAATKRAIEEFFGRRLPKKLTYAELREKMDEVASIDPKRKIDSLTAMVFLQIRPEPFTALKSIDPPKQPFKIEGSFGREGKPAARATIAALTCWFDELVVAGHVDPDKLLPWDPPEKVVLGEVPFVTLHEGRDTRIKNAIVSHDALVDLYFRDPNSIIQHMTLVEALDYRWVDESDRGLWATAYAVWCKEETARLEDLAINLTAIADRIGLDKSTPRR